MYSHVFSLQKINRDKREDICFNSGSNETDVRALVYNLVRARGMKHVLKS